MGDEASRTGCGGEVGAGGGSRVSADRPSPPHTTRGLGPSQAFLGTGTTPRTLLRPQDRKEVAEGRQGSSPLRPAETSLGPLTSGSRLARHLKIAGELQGGHWPCWTPSAGDTRPFCPEEVSVGPQGSRPPLRAKCSGPGVPRARLLPGPDAEHAPHPPGQGGQGVACSPSPNSRHWLEEAVCGKPLSAPLAPAGEACRCRRPNDLPEDGGEPHASTEDEPGGPDSPWGGRQEGGGLGQETGEGAEGPQGRSRGLWPAALQGHLALAGRGPEPART